MRTRTVITEEIEGVDCELSFEPVSWIDTHMAKVGDKLVIAYCVYDYDCDVDDMMGDCMGKLYSFHRHSDNAGECLEALGNNRDGERDLDKVWDRHEEEARRRYVETVLRDHRDEDTVVEYEERSTDYERREGETVAETARRYVTADAEEGYGWRYVAQGDVMEAVLEEMWEDPAYFPGDRDAQLLACYEHGGQVWSLSGGGMQCRWDTSNRAGVWVPDDYLKKELDSTAPGAAFAFVRNTNWIRGTGKHYQLVKVVWDGEKCNEVVHVAFSDDSSELHAQAKAIAAESPAPTPKQIAWGREQMCEVYAKQFLNTYNDIIAGNVYGCVVEWFDEDGNSIDNDACWGFIGDHAEEALKTEFFDPVCERLRAEVAV